MAKMQTKQEGSLSVLADGTYRLRYTNGTKQIIDKKTGLLKTVKNQKDFTGKSEQIVRQKFDKWKKEQEKLKEREYSQNKYKEEPIMVCIYDWINNVKSLTLKESSFSRLIQVTDNYVFPRLRYYTVGEINNDVLQEQLITDLYNQGFSYSTIKKSYNVMTGFYKWAVATGKVAVNPTPALVLPSENKIKEEQGVDNEVKYYSKEDYKKFKKTADERNKYCNDVQDYRFPRAYVYLFIVNTGLRIGEMLALTWDDYDAENKTIKVNKNIIEYKDAKTRKIVTKLQNTPKTESSNRTIPLNKAAIEALEKIKERTYDPNNPYIVANKGTFGAKPYTAPSNIRSAFKRFCTVAGVEHKGLHALRHTFASLMFAQGVEIKYISKWLGHSSVQITYDTYVHIMEEVGYKEKSIMPDFDI